jgi:hypothetical protein
MKTNVPTAPENPENGARRRAVKVKCPTIFFAAVLDIGPAAPRHGAQLSPSPNLLEG